MAKSASASEEKVVLSTGFHGGRRLRRGDTFISTKDHEANWFKPVSSTDREVKEVLAGEPNLLDRSIPVIIRELPSLSGEELNALHQNERNGKSRKGLIAAIEDEKANRIGLTDQDLAERAEDMME